MARFWSKLAYLLPKSLVFACIVRMIKECEQDEDSDYVPVELWMAAYHWRNKNVRR